MGATHIIPARPILPSLDRFLGCALGGALGDALGYAVEFDNWEAIQSRFGENGICSPQLDSASGKALISDDTQMTIFTIDGILTSVSSGIDWEFHPRLIHDVTCSYLKWLHTQTGYHPSKPQSMTWESVNRLNYDLMALPELFQKRAPGNTCISALMERAEDEHALLSNHSKGCGGVMRVAPIGMYSYMNNVEAYRYGKDIAAITHRHSASSQASGAMASIISLIMNGKSIRQAVKQTLTLLKKEDFGDKETEAALCCAIRLADDKDISVQNAIRELGEGWIAEEALSIAVYCAMSTS